MPLIVLSGLGLLFISGVGETVAGAVILHQGSSLAGRILVGVGASSLGVCCVGSTYKCYRFLNGLAKG